MIEGCVNKTVCTVVVSQPTYLPWLGYFEQIEKADTFVFLDSVQYARRSWQSRNRLKGEDDEPLWLSVPVENHPRSSSLMDIRLSDADTKWRKKHLLSIKTNLGGTPFFKEVFPTISEWLEEDFTFLADLTISGIRRLSELLGQSTPFLRASEMGIVGNKTELLVKICTALGATRYYTSEGSKDYLQQEEGLFAKAGIVVEYQGWQHPVYSQKGQMFLSHMSVIDALMNVGPGETRRLILDRS